MAGLEAAAVRLNITPPVGIRMAGYAAREHGAEGVHDELYADALYLRHGEVEAAIVRVDVCWLPLGVIEELRRRITEATGLPGSRVLVNVSHTHYGPMLTDAPRPGTVSDYHLSVGELERRNAGALLDKLVSLVGWARSRAVPARFSHGRVEARIGTNRRERQPDGSITIGVNRDGPVLPYVDLARFDAADGTPLAVLFAHACHPTSLSATDYQISADWPGVARGVIEAEAGCPALFLQGCGADINPCPRPGWEHVLRHGRRIGHAVLKHLSEMDSPREVDRLTMLEREAPLPLEAAPPLDSVRELLAEKTAAVAEHRRSRPDQALPYWLGRETDWASELLEACESGGAPDGVPVRSQVLALDEWAMVALQNEMLCGHAVAIESASPYPRTAVLGYSNGGRGYFPTAEVWDEGGYEYDARIRYHGLPIARQAGEVLAEQAVGLLADSRR